MRFVAITVCAVPMEMHCVLFTMHMYVIQVPVESLVKLIGIMDKHVIDTAELQMNVLPVSFLVLSMHIMDSLNCS